MLVKEFLEKSAKQFPNKEALICQNRRLTFLEIDNAANSLANGLVEHGFQRQDRAAIYLENSVESVISVFGILKASGIFVVINPQRFRYKSMFLELRKIRLLLVKMLV